MKTNLKTTLGIAVFLLALTSVFLTSCDSKKEASEPASENAVEEQAPAAKADAVADLSTEANQEGIAEEPATEEEANVEEEEEVVKESVENTPAKRPSGNAVYMGMWGYCGGTGFLFDMDGAEGHYRPWDGSKEYGETRQLKLVSYNPKSGKCVINAYLKKKYIGQFDGIFEEAENEDDEGNSHYFQAYNGIFKSVNGSKLEFHFHFD